MADNEKQVISAYGLDLSALEIERRKKWHTETYIEYEIPKKIEKKLSKIIESEIKKFSKKCKCELCTKINKK